MIIFQVLVLFNLLTICSVYCGIIGQNGSQWPGTSLEYLPPSPGLQYLPPSPTEELKPPIGEPLPSTHTSLHQTIVKHVQVSKFFFKKK